MQLRCWDQRRQRWLKARGKHIGSIPLGRSCHRRRLPLPLRFPFSVFLSRPLLYISSGSLPINQIFTILFPKPSIPEAFQIAIPNRPQCPANAALPGVLPKTRSGTQDMSDGVHPGRLAAFKVRVDNRNPVVYLLESQRVLGR